MPTECLDTNKENPAKATKESEDIGTFEELLALDPETVMSIQIGSGPTVLTNAGKRKKAEAEQIVRDAVAAYVKNVQITVTRLRMLSRP